ncbi:MAG TPA: hypothetical protein VHA09_09930 [Nitrososphaera sp.]|nr:hypothetical protein [Nitrososphaera sp.]
MAKAVNVAAFVMVAILVALPAMAAGYASAAQQQISSPVVGLQKTVLSAPPVPVTLLDT